VKILHPNLAKENMKCDLLVFGEILDPNLPKERIYTTVDSFVTLLNPLGPMVVVPGFWT